MAWHATGRSAGSDSLSASASLVSGSIFISRGLPSCNARLRRLARPRRWPLHTPPREGAALPEQPYFIPSAVHAAAPHNDRMKIGSSWEGVALPNPPRGRGLGARASGPRPLRYGETRFPHPPAPAAYVHVSPPCGCAAQRQDEHRFFLGGRSPPKPSQGPGPGCAGLRPASAEVWGNPVSPPPSPRAYFHVSVRRSRRDGARHLPGKLSNANRRF